MTKTIKVINDGGVPFNVALEKELGVDVVVFYDERYKDGFTELGQRVASYTVDTVSKMNSGLRLFHDIPNWQVSQSNIKDIQTELLGA